MEIQVGQTNSFSIVVTPAHTASQLKSGLLDVFATPMMVAFMEQSCSDFLAELLEPGQSSVGTGISISHDAATPVGMTVTFTATVTAVDRRRVDFHVVARDEVEQIGEGTHSRFIIDAEKFMVKTNGKVARQV